MPSEPTVELAHRPREASGGARATTLSVGGMSCNNCVRHVTQALQGLPGVKSASVSLEAQQATIHWRAEVEPDVPGAIHAVEQEGFSARVKEPKAEGQGHDLLAGWRLNLWLGLPAMALLMAGEWVFGLGTVPWFRWLSLVLGTVVQVVAGGRFYRGAWGQLKARSANMDTLVALGSTTAYVYSLWALFSGQGAHLYFMEAVAIITLISTGHWLESLASVRASSALRQLLHLAPAVARRRLPDGTETEVPVAELRAGDLVALRPGDRVPTDGEVLEGNSALDESMLTGESVPVDKAAGTEVYAGTLNLNGRLSVRVTATGEETALAHIIAAVQRAQNSRANIQRLGDRVSSVFVPLVVSVALAAGLWWAAAPQSANQVHAWLAQFLWAAHPPVGAVAAAVIIAASVLIIACPCAMGLATPAAIMAGSNAAAQRGILVRDGIALEKAGQVSAVLFDKTGTLTVGKPEVVKTWERSAPGAVAGADAPAQAGPLLAWAAALAQHSTHPISQAVARLSPSSAAVGEWQEVRGAGIQGRLARQGLPPESSGQGQSAPQTLRLGSLRWLSDSGVDLAPAQAFIEQWSAEGATLIGLAGDALLVGLFALKDTLKSGAREVVERLHGQGLNVYLVTGDNALTAASIARQASIGPENVFAEVRPEQKAELVKRLQQQGERIAFVGDGINDAPALEQADLGIAVSRASDIAREAADIILLKSEIEAVPESLGLARATLRTIKQNLFWAFFYNGLGVPLAALGFMSPILCAAAMGVSDLVVIGNALRLRRWRE